LEKDGLINRFRLLLENLGINPLYFSTIVCIIVTITYWRQFKNWDKIEYWRKGLAGSALFASIVFSILSLLKLFGIINL
jgi:hypothetical protein